MREQIPKLRESIKEASMKDLKDFLENIRKYSPKMGEVAMRHTAGKYLFMTNYLAACVNTPHLFRSSNYVGIYNTYIKCRMSGICL